MENNVSLDKEDIYNKYVKIADETMIQRKVLELAGGDINNALEVMEKINKEDN